MLIAAKLIKFVEVPLDGATVAHPFNVKYACKGLPQKRILREKKSPIFVHKSLRLEVWCGSPEGP